MLFVVEGKSDEAIIVVELRFMTDTDRPLSGPFMTTAAALAAGYLYRLKA